MVYHAPFGMMVWILLGWAACHGAASAAELAVYRELANGRPQGVARHFVSPPRLLVRATFDAPLPTERIGLRLTRNAATVLDRAFDVKGDRRQFDLRLSPPDDRPFQPGIYRFAITHAQRVVAETTFMVGTILPPAPRQARVYYGPPLAEGADPFAVPPPVPGLRQDPVGRLVVFRQLDKGVPQGVGTEFTSGSALQARLALDKPRAEELGTLRLRRDGTLVTEGEIPLQDKAAIDFRLAGANGLTPGQYELSLSIGPQVLAATAFTIRPKTP